MTAIQTATAEPRVYHEHPVKPEGMTDEEWDEYLRWQEEETAADLWAHAPYSTEHTAELAGAWSPRCD